MAAENIEGLAPFAIRYSAISLLPTCDAAPSAVSQSPNPQSQAALAREGCASTSSRTLLIFPCATVTISRTISRSCAGKLFITDSLPGVLASARSRQGSASGAQANQVLREKIGFIYPPEQR